MNKINFYLSVQSQLLHLCKQNTVVSVPSPTYVMEPECGRTIEFVGLLNLKKQIKIHFFLLLFL